MGKSLLTLRQEASADRDESPAGEDHGSPSEKVNRLNARVVRLFQEGHFEEALGLAVEACTLSGNTLGKDHPDFATSLDNLAAVYKATGRFHQAEPLLKQAMEIRRKALGERDPDFVMSLNNLGGLYLATGRYTEAEKLYLRAMEIIRGEAGEENPFFVRSLNNLASLYKAMGNYLAVEPLYVRARDILLGISGENHPDYAVVLSNLAHHYSLVGRTSRAESLYQQSLEITRKTLGKGHPQYARTLNNLASLHEAMGRFAKAQPLYQEALEIFSSRQGKDSPDVAAALNNLAGLYRGIGDYAKAESFFRQANEIRRISLGERSPEFALGLNNLADLHYRLGDLEAAEQLYEKALEIEQTTLGEKHPDVALTLQNLAVLYRSTGRYPEAEAIYLQALAVWKSLLGERHPSVALTLHNLATLRHAMGRYSEADPLYCQALEIRSTLLGEHHPDVADTLHSLAALRVATHREHEAFELMKRAQGINDHLIRDVLSMASEGQRLRYLAFLRAEQDLFLSFMVRHLMQSQSAVAAGFDLVLKRKAIVAEAMAAERDTILSGRYPDLEKSLLELRTLRIQIARKTLSGPGPEGPAAHREVLEKWKAEKERLEVYLAGRVPEFALERRLMEADRQAVASALPQGAILIEFVRYDVFDFLALAAKNESLWRPPRYLAFLLHSREPQRILAVDLGRADEIDRMIADLRATITGAPEKTDGRGIVKKGTEGARPDTGAGLRKAVLDPLLQWIDGKKRLLIAPDGDLYRLPFCALPSGDDRTLLDDFLISYVGTGRDILRFGRGSAHKPAPPLVMSDPDYDLSIERQPSASGETASRRVPMRNELQRHAPFFGRLPGTRIEGTRISTMLRVEPMLDRMASKENLLKARSPRILHMATHGFFLPEQARSSHRTDSEQAPESGVPDVAEDLLSRSMENPLLRSGLALAGANAWLEGKHPPAETENGILTGEDASGLDLLATELVVLSACETGLGPIRVGEGVFGLRRAFLLAGAKTLVMSLWKIPDEQTVALMEGLYKRLLDGTPRADALRETQMDVKKKHPDPFFWAAFVCQGDPGPLSPLPVKD